MAARHARDTRQVRPFLATFHRHSDNPFRNYAIPDDGATPSPADVAALVAAYRHRDRTPRLEYLPDLAPAVEAALVAARFAVEGRFPLMVCAPGRLRARPIPAGIELVAPRADDELLAAVAYDEPPRPVPRTSEWSYPHARDVVDH